MKRWIAYMPGLLSVTAVVLMIVETVATLSPWVNNLLLVAAVVLMLFAVAFYLIYKRLI